ncbi:unnamed protein product [Rhizoctonia solani]|uniref:Uncharacterized protein n=2 Tax=Rhizoctonia solani TaxID=456999 RepID=A0A8H3HGR7_9AGAM|nr:hypothetical protein RSOL_134370 [Rhizoctonia solani AG-3 Rhs1AP]CAE6428091.1 unnamed protein product [Rhizoctonia solani]CAE6507602.1 unnamed protein product [Rhizoctonia solani]
MVLTRSQTKAIREAELKSNSQLLDPTNSSQHPSQVLRLVPEPHQKPTLCWVDASLTRIAVLIGQDYLTFSLKKGWQTKKRDINWAETIAFELLAQVLFSRGHIGTVKVSSDSHTALRAVAGSKVRVREIIESTQRLNTLMDSSGFTLKGVKVSTKRNLADPFTRGKKVDGYRRMMDAIVVPEALAPFVVVE